MTTWRPASLPEAAGQVRGQHVELGAGLRGIGGGDALLELGHRDPALAQCLLQSRNGFFPFGVGRPQVTIHGRHRYPSLLGRTRVGLAVAGGFLILPERRLIQREPQRLVQRGAIVDRAGFPIHAGDLGPGIDHSVVLRELCDFRADVISSRANRNRWLTSVGSTVCSSGMAGPLPPISTEATPATPTSV